jgi:Tol biopolymer transport system component
MPALVVELSTPDHEGSMEISSDGLTMYFSSNRLPTLGSVDIFVTTRPDRMTAWSPPAHVVELSTVNGDYNAQPWSDTLLFVGSNGGSNVYRSTRASAVVPWSTPTVVAGLDTPMYEGEAFADAARAMWFTGPGVTSAEEDLWCAEPSGDSYLPATRVTELATTDTENDAWLSPDRRTIFFTSNRNGSLDIFTATR